MNTLEKDGQIVGKLMIIIMIGLACFIGLLIISERTGAIQFTKKPPLSSEEKIDIELRKAFGDLDARSEHYR